VLALLCLLPCYAGVSRAIQDRYRRNYENKALFLKIPVFSERQYIFISGQSIRPEQAAPGALTRFKVGDQVRITGIDFGGEEIRFRCSSISGVGLAEIIFKFDASLQENFPNSNVFDEALQAAFTEGLKYSDLEDAKRGYAEDQFDRVVRELAASSGTTREAVLKSIAPKVPAYQDALRDLENLRNRNQELATLLAQSQTENRKLDADLRAQQGENTRLRGLNASLQEKIDSSTSQLSKLGEDLRTVRGAAQGYQRELANLQKSFNLKVDANRDMAAQITDLGQAMRKIQRENESLTNQVGSLQSHNETLQSEKTRLTGELEDLKGSNRKMKETIDALTSREDSLARQYIQLKQVKENLENITNSVENLSAHVAEEKIEGGIHSKKIDFYLKNVLIGTLHWQFPSYLSQNAEKTGQAQFTMESIDYVRVAPDERALLRSFGERLKLQLKLVSPSAMMEVIPEKDEGIQEIGERDQATWRWRILNRGAQDTWLGLSVHLINKNSDAIPILQVEHMVASSSAVRQVRNILQPLPLGLGAILGLLLVGLVRIFWRPRQAKATLGPSPGSTSSTSRVVGRKQL
jgi:predicted nuclease with TOPRIM domain